MAKIALNLTNLSINGKINKGRTALTAAGTTEGIAVLGTPAPAEVAALLAATDDLEAKRDARQTADNAAKTATQAQKVSEDLFNTAYAAYGRVGQTKSGGDPTKIGQVGLDVASAPAPIGALSAPVNLAVSTGDFPNTLDAQCDKVTGAVSYAWRYTTDPTPNAVWINAPITTKSSTTITGLTSGTKYYVQVAAVGAAGQSPWSDLAEGMAT